jgi:hypothetical protein
MCEYRALIDRAVAEGSIMLPPEAAAPKPYADLGSCIHAEMQETLGCAMPKSAHLNVDALTSAATLFPDAASCSAAISAAVRAAISVMPKSPDGRPWQSEYPYKYRDVLTGHIDFLSQDESVIVDLKTTARKPDHHRIKAEHFVQMCAYKILVPKAKLGYVLYVDSMKASWAMLSQPIDYTTDDMVEYLEQLEGYARGLRRKSLLKTAMPRVGSHCQSSFCPYTSICRDTLIPPASAPVDTPLTPKFVSPI